MPFASVFPACICDPPIPHFGFSGLTSLLEVALALPLAEHRAACADRIAALHQRVMQLSSPSSELCTTMALRLASGEALTSLAMHPKYMEVTCQAAASFFGLPIMDTYIGRVV